MQSIYEALERAETIIAEAVQEGREVEPEELGLDERASYRKLVVMDDAIIARSESDNRVLSYYGGFEYVDSEHVTQIGRYTIYSADCDRVQGCIEHLMVGA